MKEKILKIVRKLLLIGMILVSIYYIGFGVLFVISIKTDNFYLGANDTIATLGNGSFEIRDFNTHIALEDHRFNDDKFKIIVNKIEKYALKDDELYMIGYYASSMDAVDPKDGTWKSRIAYYDLKTGKGMLRQAGTPAPHYLILNTRKAEMRTYVAWEEIPPEEQLIFKEAKAYSSG